MLRGKVLRGKVSKGQSVEGDGKWFLKQTVSTNSVDKQCRLGVPVSTLVTAPRSDPNTCCGENPERGRPCPGPTQPNQIVCVYH